MADPGSKAYGALTIAVQYDPETVGDLRPMLQKLRETL